MRNIRRLVLWIAVATALLPGTVPRVRANDPALRRVR